MSNLLLSCLLLLLVPGAPPQKTSAPPPTMTKIVVRLSGPRIEPGSFSALPKTIYSAGDRYARLEDPPDARQKIQKLTVIDGANAYSANLISKTGSHAIDRGAANSLHLPIVLPFDPKHQLGKLDGIEFGAEYDFFQAAGARKEAGPPINAKPTDSYTMSAGAGLANLIVRGGTDVPVYLSWQAPAGTYKYEYIVYAELPFDAQLFTKPPGIRWKELPSDPAGAAGDR